MSGRDGTLDTNTALRIFLQDIPFQHDKALELVKDHERRFLVPDVAIVEFVFALRRHYGFTREQVVDTATELMKIPNLDINRSIISVALSHYVNHPKLSFEDCYLAEMANQNNAEPLYTFDRKLAAQHQSVELL
jgi:predicted nucleic acid-binding protein